jgi:hypothetical protein
MVPRIEFPFPGIAPVGEGLPDVEGRLGQIETLGEDIAGLAADDVSPRTAQTSRIAPRYAFAPASANVIGQRAGGSEDDA